MASSCSVCPAAEVRGADDGSADGDLAFLDVGDEDAVVKSSSEDRAASLVDSSRSLLSGDGDAMAFFFCLWFD